LRVAIHNGDCAAARFPNLAFCRWVNHRELFYGVDFKDYQGREVLK